MARAQNFSSNWYPFLVPSKYVTSARRLTSTFAVVDYSSFSPSQFFLHPLLPFALLPALPIMNDDDDDHDLLLLGKHGRSKGNSTFKIDEDVKLASAYVFVTTNAAIGTDQDGITFWQKIRDNFVRRGGLPTRTLVSLKNRFNKVLQAEINKYIGHLHSALREYHSGWSMGDYVAKAKAQFHLKTGKHFKHEIVYGIMKRTLPKYEIATASIDARVCRALFLLDSDKENDQRDAAGGTSYPITGGVAGVSGRVVDVDGHDVQEATLSPDDSENGLPGTMATSTSDDASLSLLTPRPTIGKKKAKVLSSASVHSTKKKKVELQSTIAVRECRNDSLKRLADAAEAKNRLMQEQLMFQVFMSNPNSAASKAYFEQRSLRYFNSLTMNEHLSDNTNSPAVNDAGECDFVGMAELPGHSTPCSFLTRCCRR
jgi:hypothetical protein